MHISDKRFFEIMLQESQNNGTNTPRIARLTEGFHHSNMGFSGDIRPHGRLQRRANQAAWGYLSKEVGNVKTSELRMTFTMMKGGGSCNNT